MKHSSFLKYLLTEMDDSYADAPPRSAPEDSNPTDSVTVDVPLLIRLMEYAKEDAADDMALHRVAERLTQLSAEGKTLTMDDYDAIVGGDQGGDEMDMGDDEQMDQEDPRGASMTESTYEMYFGGNKTKRFQAASREEAQATARKAGAESVIRVTSTGKPVGKVGNNLLKEEQSGNAAKKVARLNKIAQLKRDYADRMRWSKEEATKTGRDRSGHAQSASKIKAHLRNQYGVEV